MKYFLLLLTLVFLSESTLFSQSDPKTVSFVSYWSVGDVYNFKITKLKKQWKEGKVHKKDSSQYVSTFEVMDSTADSYTIKWTFKNNITSTYKLPEELREKFAKYDPTEVIYKTDELGTYAGIENWKEISAMTKEMFKDLIESLSGPGKADKEQLEKAMQPIAAIYSSKEGIEQLVFKELVYFHFPFGVEYNTDEPILYEESLPNMLGGDPLKGEAKLYFKSVDYKKSRCVLVQEMKINEDDTKRMITQLFKKMGFNSKDMNAAMKTAKFDISDNNKYEYYYNPGVPIKIETNRQTVVDIGPEKMTSLEKTIIELVD